MAHFPSFQPCFRTPAQIQELIFFLQCHTKLGVKKFRKGKFYTKTHKQNIERKKKNKEGMKNEIKWATKIVPPKCSATTIEDISIIFIVIFLSFLLIYCPCTKFKWKINQLILQANLHGVTKRMLGVIVNAHEMFFYILF